ncbi:MAG: AAA family ATPase, partial [Candidatus Omnitrophota bacterium]
MIKRNILNKLQQELTRPEIIILLGVRQVGKTTLLKMLEHYAKRKGRKTAFFDLEQPQVLADFNRPDKEIAQMISVSGEIVFIDEFQYVRNISKIFKAIFDSKKKIKIICSGSSSLEIHKHLKESLAGRRFLYRIFPLEYTEIKNSRPDFKFEDYLRFGGMPGLTHTNSTERKQQILNELLGSYILKDVKSLVKEENIRAFNHLLYLLAERQCSTISVHSLSAEVGLSSKAINHYLDILEETYVNYRIYSYSRNLGNELKKSCKTYLYDLG